jgi:signal transduction histidine kinase
MAELEPVNTSKRGLSYGWFAFGGLLVALVAAIVYAVLLMSPPAKDIRDMSTFLLISGSLSLVIGYLGFRRFGLGSSLPSLRLKIMVIYIAGLAIAFVNVVVTAVLMFLSEHDLKLLSVLLIFALVISLFSAYFLAESMSRSVRLVMNAAGRLAEGKADERVPVQSADELGRLASAFNQMADRLAEASAQQQRVENARRELIAAVSHDLRTPLASIRAMVEAVNDGVVRDPETVRRYLVSVQSETQRLGALIDDLFELSQIEAGALKLQLARASLEDVVSDTLESMDAQARLKGVALSGKVEGTLPPVYVDTRKFQRVLYNLVQKAIRHTPADGAVTLIAREWGNEVEVQVADSGEGIAERDLPHIFDRFYRGEPSRSRDTGGAGLGLAIARGIVEAHGGRIWAESNAGRGSRFFITLPRAAALG